MSEPKTTVRHRYCGLRDVYVAKVTQNDTEGYTAGTPVKMARAIKAKISDKFTSEKLYSDDGVEGTQDGQNKAPDVTLWALPAMDCKQRTITWDSANCDVTVEYTPLWL